jgi:peptidoglycan/LPS O-acetylase OafA/YrhL
LPSTGSTERLHALDGLRGVLALFVCIYHFSASFPPVQQLMAAYAYVLRNGWFAVDVFFVLSGFVMCHVYQHWFAEGVKKAAYRDFMKARVARLYPVHLFSFALLFVALTPFIATNSLFTSHDGRYAWSAAILNVALLHAPFLGHLTWNYPSWSISAEMAVYLAFPFLAPFANRKNLVLAGALVALCIVFLMYAQGSGASAYPTNGPGVILRAFCLFIVGMAAYQWRETGRRVGDAGAAALVAVALALLSFERSASFAVFLVAPLVLATIDGNWLATALSRPTPLFLGRISYSLYMIHAVVQILVLDRVKFLAGATGWPISAGTAMMLAAALVSILAADRLNRSIEIPARGWLTGRLASRPQGIGSA